MYVPPAFQETRIEVMQALIREHPLGLLVTAGPGGLLASPVPFLLAAEPGPLGTLRAHLARANPHVAELAGGLDCLVVFQGPQGYVSPAWYPSAAETGRAVPTWNYAVVQARGVARLVDEAGWLREQIDGLTRAQEARRDPSWDPAMAPEDFLRAQMAAVVGLELAITGLEAKWKMSQNRAPEDRAGVIRGLGCPADPHAHPRLAEEVTRRDAERTGS